MDNPTHTLTVPRDFTYREGFGVYVEPIWGWREPSADELEDLPEDWQDHCEPDVISDIEIAVMRIAPDTVSIVGRVPCVQVWPNAYVPVENFGALEDLWQDDTHDLRSRYFETEEDAREHAEYTERRWRNPSPWESFVAV